MIAALLTIIIAFFAINFFGYVIHWSFHQKWMGQFNKSHMAHHLKLYPPEDYLSDTYRDAGKDNTTKLFAAAVIPLLIILLLSFFFGLISLKILLLILVELAIVGWLHNYLHDAFHIRNHLLTKVPFVKNWFGKLVDIHYLHHVDMQKNFGIFFFFWDKVFKTYWRQ